MTQSKDCQICMGTKRVKVGMSFPPNRTIDFKVEYDPCPNCTPGPHSYHALIVAQRLADADARAIFDGGKA